MPNLKKLLPIFVFVSLLVPVFLLDSSPLASIPADQPSFIEKLFNLNSRYIIFGSSIAFAIISVVALAFIIILLLIRYFSRRKNRA